MDTLWHDLRYGARMLWKKPGFTLIAVLTLALGIGANTAIFSVINAVLLRPLPYEDPDRLVWMSETGDEVANRWVSHPNFLDWRERNRVFEAMSTFRGASLTMTGAGEPESLDARMVAADYFRVMRVRPMLGRDFTSDDDRPGASPVTILSYGFWQTRFGGDANVIGKNITLDDRDYTIVGVMPRSFVHQGSPPLWVLVGPQNWTGRDVRIAGYVIARLKPGVTVAQARAEMSTISEQLFREHPRANAGGHRVNIVSLHESITGNVRPALLVLFGAVGFVLLIACANVANLLLARAATRQKEFAVCAALGATRWRIVRQLLAECVLLAVVGGGLGLLLAWWGTDLLAAVRHYTMPRLADLTVSRTVLAFNLLLSVLTGIIFGLAPAWQVSGVKLDEVLKEGGRRATDGRSTKLRRMLVVAEVALSVALLVGAGLLVRSMMRLVESDPGFDSGNVVTMELRASRQRYADRSPQLRLLHQQLLARVRAVPGVESVSLSNNLPGLGDGWQNDIWPEGHPPLRPGEMINVDWTIASADYFSTMRIPILRGRTFTKQEVNEGLPVVLVDENLARRFWPNEDAVGIYSVMSYMVAERTHEIGVRRALGARERDVLGLFIRQGMKLVSIGVAIGLIGAFVLTRLMKNLLFGVSATDPATFVVIAGLLAGVALAACYVPARRAMKVDPMVALRYE